MITDLFLTLAQTATQKAQKTEGLLHKWSFGHVGNSTQAYETEWLYIFIVWVNIIAFFVVMIPMVWFVFKYHRSKAATNYQASAAHNTPLELAWSIIPLLVMVPIFFWGFEGYVNKLAAPSDSEEIQVKGQMWQWTAVYRNGAECPPKDYVTLMDTGNTVPMMVVPANRPVKLIMHSADVIHSFFIPDFRTKMDVFPNRYTSMWFEAREPTQRGQDGTWTRINPDTGKTDFAGHKVFCAEYCGNNHSEMVAGLVVLTPEEYAQTLAAWADPYDGGNMPPIEIGKIAAVKRACATCHSIDGSKNTGPTWKNWFGYENTYADGSKHLADETWLRDNILYSQRHIVQGFPTSMPLYAGVLKDIEVNGLIEYIKSLSDKGPYTNGAAPAPAGGDAPAEPASSN